MNNVDVWKIKEMYNITLKIYNEIENLLFLDIENKEKDFQKINELLKEEEEIYNTLNDYDLTSYCDYIINENCYNIENNLNYAKENKKEFIIKARIVNNLYKLIDKLDIDCEYDDNDEEEIIDDDDELIDYIDTFPDEELLNEVYNTFDDMDNVSEVVTKDILKLIFKLVEINLQNNYSLKQFKYNLAFIYNDFLKTLLKADFKYNNDIYLEIGTNTSLYHLSENLLLNIFDEVTWRIIIEQIKNKNREELITNLIIRSALVFSSVDVINKLKSILKNNDLEILNYLDEDREIPKLVFFKK